VLSSLGFPTNDSLDIGGRDIRPDKSAVPHPPDEELAQEGDKLELDDEDGEQTVVLNKLPSSSSPKPAHEESNTPPETPLPAHPELQTPAAVPPESARKRKVSMNPEMERIVVSVLIVASSEYIQLKRVLADEDMEYCGRDHHAWPSFRCNGFCIWKEQTSKSKGDSVRC